MAHAAIRRLHDESKLYAPPVVLSVLSDQMAYTSVGSGQQLVSEFAGLSSERAQAEWIATQNQKINWPSEEADVRMAMRLVQLVIKYDTDKDVGGPIDAVELNKGGTVHWIQRKSNCGDFHRGPRGQKSR